MNVLTHNTHNTHQHESLSTGKRRHPASSTQRPDPLQRRSRPSNKPPNPRFIKQLRIRQSIHLLHLPSNPFINNHRRHPPDTPNLSIHIIGILPPNHLDQFSLSSSLLFPRTHRPGAGYILTPLSARHQSDLTTV
jgi:hypothetical protein